VIIPFGEFLPDQPDLGNPGVTLAKNVLPYAQAYGQLKSLLSFTSAVSSATAVLSSTWVKGSDGLIYVHCGTATRLEELQSDATWDNVSIAGNYAGATSWEWAQFGDRIIAVDLLQNPQYFDVGTSTLYADLAGSPPKAKHIAGVRDFIVLGNTTSNPTRLVWSGYNNTELWTPSRATQSDQRDLRGQWGDIQRIVPGQYGVVFQQRAISILTYTGPPAIFSLNLAEKGRGTPAPESVCWQGQNVYYLGDDGFYVFNQGSQAISTERVNRWFFNELDLSSIGGVKGVIDARNQMVIWTFKSSVSLAYSDRILFYNWGANKWSYGELDTEVLSQYTSTGLTLDDLDTVLTDIDAESIPVDSDAYQNGSVSLVAFNELHEMSLFEGAALTATLETSEWGENERLATMEARPLVSGTPTQITVEHGYRNTQNENVTWSAAKSVTAKGTVNFRNNSRFNRSRVSVTGGFENAIGVDVTATKGGRR